MVPSSDDAITDVKKDPIESDVHHQGCCAWYQFKGETSAKGFCMVGYLIAGANRVSSFDKHSLDTSKELLLWC
jgi:hypothetical protein